MLGEGGSLKFYTTGHWSHVYGRGQEPERCITWVVPQPYLQTLGYAGKTLT